MSYTLGKLIKKSRNVKKLTQLETSKKIGISRNYLSDIENDRYMPSVPVLIKLSKELEIDLNLLTKMTEKLG